MNLKKQTTSTGKKLPAGGQRLSLSDFETRETQITSANKLDQVVGGTAEADANPRPPLIVIVR
jgi:hypothetical protein